MRAVQAAREGAKAMRALPLYRRAEILRAAAAKLLQETDTLGRLITPESGKTIREAKAEVARAVVYLCPAYSRAGSDQRKIRGRTAAARACASQGRR